jgi:hypothetical protein
LSGVSGAGLSPAQTISPIPSAASRSASTAAPGFVAAPIALPAASNAVFASPATPAASSSAFVGSGLGCHGARSGSGGRGTGVTSNRTVARSTPVVLEALDEPALPQRLGAVERLRVDPRGQPPELLLGAGRGQRAVAQVVLEVEVGIVDPERATGLERRVRELLPVAGDQVEAAAEVLEDVHEGGRRTLEDRDRADVHVRIGVLLVQEGRVNGGQAIEVLLRHGPPLPRSRRKSDFKRIPRTLRGHALSRHSAAGGGILRSLPFMASHHMQHR